MKLNITIDEADVVVDYEEHGRRLKKNVDINDFLRTVSENNINEFPLLPIGTRYIMTRGGVCVLAIEKQAQVREFNLSLNNEHYKLNIPYPHLLFIFKLVQRQIQFSRLFAMHHSLLSLSQTLYRFPFSNANPNICWGQNKLPKLKNWMDLETLMTMFLQSPFNNDLGGMFNHFNLDDVINFESIKLGKGAKVDRTSNLALFLKDKNSFPLDLLNSYSIFAKAIPEVLEGGITDIEDIENIFDEEEMEEEND